METRIADASRGSTRAFSPTGAKRGAHEVAPLTASSAAFNGQPIANPHLLSSLPKCNRLVLARRLRMFDSCLIPLISCVILAGDLPRIAPNAEQAPREVSDVLRKG